MNDIEYVFDVHICSNDGEQLYYYEIFEKNGNNESFVDRSIKTFDTFKSCNDAAEKHIESLEKGAKQVA